MSVSARLKRMTLTALGAVLLIAAGLLIAPWFISEDAARNAAVQALRSVVGVEPTVGGPVRLTLLPRPSVQLENVRIEDGNRPAFTAETLRATVQVLPLFSGRVEVASLTLEQPRLAIDLARDGVLAVGLPLLAPGAAVPVARPEVRFSDGVVLFRSEGSERVERLTAVDGAIAWTGTTLTATGSFRWRAAPASLSVSIADTVLLSRGERTALRARIETDALKIGFDGGIAYRNGVQADGALTAEAQSLRTALTLVSLPPLAREGFGPFKLKAQAALTANSLALTGLSIDLDGNRAEGGLTAKYDGARAVVQATLASETVDFTPYAAGFAVSGADGRDWSREPIDLAALDRFDLDVRLSSGRVVVRKTELSRVAAAAAVRAGKFTLTVGDAQFHGGTFRGRLALDRAMDGTPLVKVETNIANFDLGPGMAEIIGIPRLEGKGTLALALEGTGTHIREISHDLSGVVNFTAKDGALNGVNVEQVLRRLERKPLSTAQEFAGGRTPFDKLAARLRVSRGTASIEDAQMESALVRVRVLGETSVATRDFDLKGMATLVRASAPAGAAPAFELPFLVVGPWDRPLLLPHPGSLSPFLDAGRRLDHRDKAAAQDEEIERPTDAPTAASAPASETNPSPQ